MRISFTFISGFMIGFELVDKAWLDEGETGTMLGIDLGIIRFLIERI